MYDDNFLSDSDSRTQSNPMENPILGIRCRIVARTPTGIHRFDGNSHKIRSDSYGIRIRPVVELNLLGVAILPLDIDEVRCSCFRIVAIKTSETFSVSYPH